MSIFRYVENYAHQMAHFVNHERIACLSMARKREKLSMWRLVFAWTLIATLSTNIAYAQSQYPVRPVRLIVPAAAGGTIDIVARVISQELIKSWKQQIIVDNRPGAGNTLGIALAASANPDGYTLLLSSNSVASAPALFSSLPYNTRNDLTPVVLVAAQPMAIGANISFRANSISDLISVARTMPRKISYGSAGSGSAANLAMEMFKAMAKVEIVFIPYKGGNLATSDVLGNNIPLVMTGLPNLLPLHRARKLKILGISQLSAVAPDIPLIRDALPEYEFVNWFGLIVPSGISGDLIRKLNQDVNSVLGATEVKQILQRQGFEILGGTTAQFARKLQQDIERFAEIIKQMKLEQK